MRFFVLEIAIFVAGATTRRGKELAANVNDSVWALNKDTVMLNCSHPGGNGDVWSQRAPDGTVSFVPPSHVKAFVGGSMLTVSMSPSLNGTSYRCVLTDLNAAPVFRSGWITLLLGDAINMTCASQATVCATETQTLMKRCSISGLPTPIITVQKTSGPPSSLPPASLSGLSFSAVTLENRGVYTVTGRNTLEEKRFNVSVQLGVDICVAPMMVIISIPDTIFCLNVALINYTAKGISAPDITWNSSFAERAVVHTLNEYSIGITSFVESTLEITPQREDNQISFCVTAENSVASTSQCYSRNVACSPPGAPFAQVVDIRDTSFNLSIMEPQFNGGNEVLSYNISVSSSDTQMETYNVPKTGKETLYVVKGLSPRTGYTISVTAVNIIGKGPPFTFNNEVLTAGRPEGVGENDCIPTLRRVHVDPLVINWTYVCEGSQTLKEITSYVIVLESLRDYRQFSVEKVVNEYSFCDLHFNTTYNLSVTAVTQNGAMRKSNVLSVSINKYSETTSVKASPDNTGLIAGVAVLGVLFVASGLIALYLFCYIKRSNKQNQNADSATGGSASKTGKPVEMQSSVLYESAKSVVSKGDPKHSSTAEYAQIS